MSSFVSVCISGDGVTPSSVSSGFYYYSPGGREVLHVIGGGKFNGNVAVGLNVTKN